MGLISLLYSCKNAPVVAEKVTEFKGQQVTGVTVNSEGRVFANFPRWRETVEYSVVEVQKDGSSQAYPNLIWNSWTPGQPISDSVFIAVQSVVAHKQFLYILDTRNPLWKGVVSAPRVFVFDMEKNELSDILILSEGSYKSNSYINDLRVDDKHNAIYFTDSNEAALVIYDLNTHSSRRVLDNHISTTAETDHLMFGDQKWGGHPVHSDGIALNTNNNRLYYHALTGYTLYSVSTDLLFNGTLEQIENDVKKEAITPAPDGMIFDHRGNLFMADLENNKIVYYTSEIQQKTLLEGENVKWADTFSIYDGYLYYTNSRINEVKGDVSDMIFSIYKVKIENL